MKQALMLLALVAVALQAGTGLIGYRPVYQIGYGAITLMAGMIALTFLWLWAKRATPLALGMAFSWAGTGFVMGWWWLFNILGKPDWAMNNAVLFNFLALYFVGAVLHFAVIHRSFGLHGAAFLWPVVTALGLSTVIYLAV